MISAALAIGVMIKSRTTTVIKLVVISVLINLYVMANLIRTSVSAFVVWWPISYAIMAISILIIWNFFP